MNTRQFKTMGLAILSEKSRPTSVTWEYSGTLQGRQLHFYAKAEQGEGKVYLVTATATEPQWKTLGAKLKACVESFALENGGKEALATENDPRD